MFNLGGCRELVRSVLSSILTYLMIALHPPKQFYKDLDKIRHRLFWSRMQQLHGGQCKVNWSRVCQPIHRDGFGILNLDCFGRALCLTWLWVKRKSPDKPWCSTDLPVDSVDEAMFTTTTRVTVHNGKKAKFWLSSWVNGGSPALMFLGLFNHTRRKQHLVTEAMHNNTWISILMHDPSASLLVYYMLL
jgi:hypothetical protein